MTFQNSTPFIYADDLKFVRRVEGLNDVFLLQSDLDRLYEWCKNNGMTLNAKKCSHIKITRKNNKINSSYRIGQETLRECDVVMDLGVHIDSKLTFVPHVDKIVRKASRMTGFIIRNSRKFRKPQTKIKLFCTLVRSILEFASIIWRPHYSTHILRIERLQKRFLWHVSSMVGMSNKTHTYKDRLDRFRMISLDRRRDLLDLSFLFKVLRNQVDCPLLLSSLRINVPVNYPRHPVALLSPPLRKTVLGYNSFIPRICRIYNSCHKTVEVDINFQSLSQFKKKALKCLP